MLKWISNGDVTINVIIMPDYPLFGRPLSWEDAIKLMNKQISVSVSESERFSHLSVRK